MIITLGKFDFYNPPNCLFYGNNEDAINFSLNYLSDVNSHCKIYDESEFINSYQELLSPGLFFGILNTGKNIFLIKDITEKHYKDYENILNIIENDKENIVILFSKSIKSGSKIINLFTSRANIVKCYDVTSSDKLNIISKCLVVRNNIPSFDVVYKKITKLLELIPISKLVQEIKKIKYINI
jgi:hypothetical protein